jgi:hypothetical protein
MGSLFELFRKRVIKENMQLKKREKRFIQKMGIQAVESHCWIGVVELIPFI